MSDLACFESGEEDSDDEGEPVPPRRLLRAEAILARRTARLLLVVETVQDESNHQAVLRTADAFGVQHVWIIRSGIEMKKRFIPKRRQLKAGAQLVRDTQAQHAAEQGLNPDEEVLDQQRLDATSNVSMAAGRWLTLRYFDTTAACIQALREDGREIWVSSLAPKSARLDANFLARGGRIPDKLALVLGREIDGVSPEMVAAASASVFLPMQGFSESFNVSVAAALLCQRLTDLCPEMIGDLGADERNQLRRLWYAHLSATNSMLYDEYMQIWLPRAEEVAELSKRMQEQEESAEGAVAVSLLRPPEVSRVPKVNRKVRRRMQAEGQRPIVLPFVPEARPAAPASKSDKPELLQQAPSPQLPSA
jgi:tRNA(Leu) C34 or U34 (ribose-2'-O)-methylase TrmL